MFHKLKVFLIVLITVLIVAYVIPFQSIFNDIKFNFIKKNNASINLSIVNSQITSVVSDSSNKLLLKATVKDTLGNPIPQVDIYTKISPQNGSIYPNKLKTNMYGECLFYYVPVDYNYKNNNVNNTKITVSASIFSNSSLSSIEFLLIKPIIVYVPGYKEPTEVFDSMKDYFYKNGFNGSIISYQSTKGIISSSEELKNYLKTQHDKYLSKGIQVEKFIIIAHSMGGLVSRYYTCQKNYIIEDNVKKLIFISVPHKGSHIASIGENYFNDQGMKDLAPNNSFILKILPNTINKGLNSLIETGNTLGQFDEVVSNQEASLEEWGIKTDIFSVGENNFSFNNLLNGNILEASNHKLILINRKVFKRILEMIENNMPCPTKK